MIRTVTTLHPVNDRDHNGLYAERDAWMVPALAMLVHVKHLQDGEWPVMRLPAMSAEAARKAATCA